MKPKRRISWRNLAIIVALIATQWQILVWTDVLKMTVPQCADAVFKDLSKTMQSGPELDAMTVELCENLRDAGVVR